MDYTGITHVAFDADDTLWGHEHVFVDAKQYCLDLLQPYLQPGMDLEQELYRFEKVNLGIFGYGVKGFVLSMIETAIELSAGKVSGAELQRIIDLGKDMIAHPIELLPFVPEAIAALEDEFELLVITKGDLFDQENKVARSGLADRFGAVEIVSEKNEANYRSVFSRNNIDPAGLLMIGNSLKSDVLPVVAAGGRAVHLPAKFTWMHEKVSAVSPSDRWTKGESLQQVVRNILTHN